MYFSSGSILVNHTWICSYAVNTNPPETINLANRGSAPLQKVKTPSCLKIVVAHLKLFPYVLCASILCILVLIVSSGWVTYTVIKPAKPPIPNVPTTPSFSPGAVYDSAICLKKV